MGDNLGALGISSPRSSLNKCAKTSTKPFHSTIESDKIPQPYQERSTWHRQSGIVASNTGYAEGTTSPSPVGASDPHSEASDNVRDESKHREANDVRNELHDTQRREVFNNTQSSFTSPRATRCQPADVSHDKEQFKQLPNPAQEASMLAAAEQLISLSRGKQMGTRFKCEECYTFFRRRSYLGKHIRTVHLKEKPFKCDLCGRAFGHKSARTKHIRTIHMGLKPVKCTAPGCNLRFSERGNMKKHFANMHSPHFR